MFRLQSPALLGISLLLSPPLLLAGGPKHVAGATYFNHGVMGQPIHWANGQVTYFVDQGPLSATVSNQQATAMVAAAAALWNAVPTAGVNIVNGGSLNEDVSGLNIVPGSQSLAQPSDVAPRRHQLPRRGHIRRGRRRARRHLRGLHQRHHQLPDQRRGCRSSTTSIPTPPSPTL